MSGVLINGHGGREASIAWRLAEDDPDLVVNAVMGHENPTIVDAVEKTGGSYTVGDTTSPNFVGSFATHTTTELAWISSDNALAAGVVDTLRAGGIAAVGPDKAAARVEWDKSFARQLIDTIDPSLNPLYTVVDTARGAKEFLERLERGDLPAVVKPLGLTGGKGVKVMGPHFATYGEAYQIAADLLHSGEKAVMLEEKADPTAPEYTMQVFTDGQVAIAPPITVDYPYRYDDDKGPGTGGMGVFTERGSPSYLTPGELEASRAVGQELVRGIARAGLNFSGILNVGFFATPDGLKIVEANARPGDPECMNMMMLVDGNVPKILGNIATQRLAAGDISFLDAASVVVCLVNPRYAQEGAAGEPVTFSVDHEEVEHTGSQVFFASAVRGSSEGEYATVGSSRAMAIGALGETLGEARARAYAAIDRGVKGPLEYRRDIGDPEYAQAMAARRQFQ